MKSIVIRTLGGKRIGYGHYYRCLSMAEGILLLENDVRIIFILNEELAGLIEETNFNYIVSNNLSQDFSIIEDVNIDLFIFDSYLGDNEYLKGIKKKTKLMLIDDNNDKYDSLIPNILYNGNIYASKLGYTAIKNQLQLLGSKYLIMKKEYWDNNQDQYVHKKGILVTTGGTDEYEVLFKIIDSIKKIDIKIRAIIGPGYSEDYVKKIENLISENVELIYKPNSLKNYIKTSKVVITSGGSTVYEILSQKSIPVVFSIADNQDIVCSTLNKMGVEYLGKYPNIDYSNLSLLLKKEHNKDIDKEDELYNLITGEGSLLVAKEILCILDELKYR